MTRRHVAVGFLFHPPARRVLPRLRAPDRRSSAGRWAFSGGRAEPGDGDDLRATWCREMREGLGVVLDPERVVSLRDGIYENGVRWQDFSAFWPHPDEESVLTEGRGTPGSRSTRWVPCRTSRRMHVAIPPSSATRSGLSEKGSPSGL